MPWKPNRFFSNVIKSSSAALATGILIAFIFIALFANFIASPLPYYVKIEGKTYYPFFNPNEKVNLPLESAGKFSKHIDWRLQEVESILWAPIPYGPKTQDFRLNSYKGPFDIQLYRPHKQPEQNLPWRLRHWLGTAANGTDNLAQIVHGSRVSLLIGFLAVGIAAFIGLCLGSMAGYFGNHNLQLSIGKTIGLVTSILPIWFYSFYLRRFAFEEALENGAIAMLIQCLISLGIILICLTVAWLIAKGLEKHRLGRKTYNLPIDSMVMRLIELGKSMPTLLVIIIIAALFPGNIWSLAAIIGLFSWMGVARLVRGDMLKVAQLHYIDAARLQGFSELYILWKHAIPNALTSFWIVLAFGIGNAIIVEAALSFIGMQTSGRLVSWGRIMSSPINIIDQWWLIVFPGITIFIVVLSCNILGERIRDVLDPTFR